MIRPLIIAGMIAAAATGFVAEAQAQDRRITGVACNVERYSPGPQISDEIIRSWIPSSFIIKKIDDGHRFRGGNFSENNSRIEDVVQTDERIRYKLIVNSRDTRGNYLSINYNIYYFPENRRMSIDADVGATFTSLGSASGTCTGLF